MSSSDENQGLEEYLDTYKRHIDNSDDILNEALTTLDEADAVTVQLLEEADDVDSDDEIISANIRTSSRKNAYYLKASTKKPSQTKVIHKSNAADTPMDMTDDDGQVIDNENNSLEELDSEEKSETKERVYEFDEEDPLQEEHEIALGKLATIKTLHIVTENSSSKTDNEIHKCPHCSYSTKRRFLLSRHLKTHSDDRPYKCSVCDRGFKINAALLNHINSHLGNKPHACKSCEMRFNTGGELLRHVRYKHTGEKPHKCGECDYSSVELSKMRRHMRCHTGERPYQCPHCTYASPDTFKLKRHLRTHTGEKPYECDICLTRFTQSNSLKAHRLIHSVGERPVFQCTLCPTTCGRKTDLQLHMQNLHHSDHPIKCKRCGKELPDRYSYKVHVKTHEGEKCFRCNICPYASISSRHLDIHMLIHTDEKPFNCDECGCAFRQRSLLVRHINLYHNSNYVKPKPLDKSHVCPHCNRAFTRKGNLMRHMETHDVQVNIKEEKMQLKIGRKIRIQSDGSCLVPKTHILNKDTNEIIINETTDDNDEYEQGTDNFEILERLDDEEIDDDVIQVQPFFKSNNAPVKVLAKSTYTINKSNKILVMPQRSGLKSNVIEINRDQQNMAIAVDDMEDENEDYMVIEVIDEDLDEEDTETLGTAAIDENIIEIPIQHNEKQRLSNSLQLVDDSEYILPVDIGDAKPTSITIVNLIKDDE